MGFQSQNQNSEWPNCPNIINLIYTNPQYVLLSHGLVEIALINLIAQPEFMLG